MSDEADFLLARIAEDEAQAKLSVAHNAQNPNLRIPSDWIEQVADRVLAECEAKRRIVEAALADFAADDAKDPDPTTRSFNAGAAFFAHNAVLALALPYAAHPDYRDEWRPGV
jgi:hypothetical protein